MIWIDWLLLAVIAVSALLSLWRGFVREAVSLAGWLAALWVALLYHQDAAAWLSRWVASPTVRNVAGFGLLFAGVVSAAAVAGFVIGRVVDSTGLTATDRMLGVVFGVARGVLVCAVLVLLAGLTSLPQESWWHESRLLVHLQDMALWLAGFLPGGIADKVQY